MIGSSNPVSVESLSKTLDPFCSKSAVQWYDSFVVMYISTCTVHVTPNKGFVFHSSLVIMPLIISAVATNTKPVGHLTNVPISAIPFSLALDFKTSACYMLAEGRRVCIPYCDCHMSSLWPTHPSVNKDKDIKVQVPGSFLKLLNHYLNQR